MKFFLRLLAYARPYTLQAVAAVLFMAMVGLLDAFRSPSDQTDSSTRYSNLPTSPRTCRFSGRTALSSVIGSCN